MPISTIFTALFYPYIAQERRAKERFQRAMCPALVRNMKQSLAGKSNHDSLTPKERKHEAVTGRKVQSWQLDNYTAVRHTLQQMAKLGKNIDKRHEIYNR